MGRSKVWLMILLLSIVIAGVIVWLEVSWDRSQNPEEEMIADRVGGQVAVKETMETEEKPMDLKEARSGDGSLRLVGTVQMVDGEKVYELRIVEEKGDERSLAEVRLDVKEVMEIPFNSWSPDKKQVFISLSGGAKKDFWVYKVSGEMYGKEEYLSVADYWQESGNGYKIETVTGWASEDLLIVKTSSDDGSDGPSFWFVTSSRKFLRLRH